VQALRGLGGTPAAVPAETDEGERGDENSRTAARSRTVRWIESLWEGRNTTSMEEGQKEEVLAVFRELARQSRSGEEAHEYVPWQPLW
jgi:hypothetical protein